MKHNGFKFALQSTSMEQALRQVYKKHEQQLEDLKTEHLAYVNELQVRHREAVASLEEQVSVMVIINFLLVGLSYLDASEGLQVDRFKCC